MAGLFSGLKTQAMTMLPQLIQTAEPQIAKAIETALQNMTPPQQQLFLTNWKKLDTVVQTTISQPVQAAPVAPAAGKRKRTRKLKQRKH
jgi:hypothetical protein